MKKFLKSFLVWLGILALLYAFLEATFLYYASRVFPVSSLSGAGIGAGIFLQYSKNNSYPNDYIAIFGDSYAFGQGDWLLRGEHAVRPAFNAGHVLHERTGRDVVTFGFPASDSIRANNVLPEIFIGAAEKSRLLDVEDPEMIVVYFYEGNDLNDNVEVAERLIYPLLKNKNDIYDGALFQALVIPSLLHKNELTAQLEAVSWKSGFFFFHFAKNTVLDAYLRFRSGKVKPPWQSPKKGMTTEVVVDGVKSYLQDHIQSPALSLNAEQIRLGLYIFEQSLVAVQKRFPAAKIGVAYIPAVITPYEVISPNVNDYYRDARHTSQRLQPSANIRTNSDFICRQVREIASRTGFGFVDSRSRLRLVAKDRYIHGPIDWNHFNRLGYETFSEDLILLLQQLGKLPETDLPACRWEM